MFSTRRKLAVSIMLLAAAGLLGGAEPERFLGPINVDPPHISADAAVKYDYDIVYVRALRAGDKVHKRYYTDFSQPVTMEPGADLMLLHPDGPPASALLNLSRPGGSRPDQQGDPPRGSYT